ncbi:IS1 family transposase [Pragia fontium]|uniref:IS1 family transposase n=1 Tax=Pragia fontium TaxID=82985 RepID=UPI0011874026|nr:IS1 family transposase [Pragia fontium]
MNNSFPICHHCNHATQVKKHGKSRTGFQRYYCLVCRKTFQTRYVYKGNEDKIEKQIERLSTQGHLPQAISTSLQVRLSTVLHYMKPKI